MDEASKTCDLLISLMEKRQIPEGMRHCILTGIVCTYARSFGTNVGINRLSSKFEKFDNPDMRAIHNYVMEARNRMYAHRDQDYEQQALAEDDESPFFGKIRMVLDPEKGGEWMIVRSTTEPLALPKIRELCAFQHQRLTLAGQDILDRYMKDHKLTPGTYVFGVHPIKISHLRHSLPDPLGTFSID